MLYHGLQILGSPSGHLLLPAGPAMSTMPEMHAIAEKKEPQYDPLRPHWCTTCRKTFKRLPDLRRHEKIHTGDKKHVCPYEICGKAFIQSSALIVHIRSHTGEKPLKCKDCTKNFADSSSLARHRKTHSGERPFKCPFADCQKRFTRKASCTRHQTRHQGTLEEAQAWVDAEVATIEPAPHGLKRKNGQASSSYVVSQADTTLPDLLVQDEALTESQSKRLKSLVRSCGQSASPDNSLPVLNREKSGAFGSPYLNSSQPNSTTTTNYALPGFGHDESQLHRSNEQSDSIPNSSELSTNTSTLETPVQANTSCFDYEYMIQGINFFLHSESSASALENLALRGSTDQGNALSPEHSGGFEPSPDSAHSNATTPAHEFPFEAYEQTPNESEELALGVQHVTEGSASASDKIPTIGLTDQGNAPLSPEQNWMYPGINDQTHGFEMSPDSAQSNTIMPAHEFPFEVYEQSLNDSEELALGIQRMPEEFQPESPSLVLDDSELDSFGFGDETQPLHNFFENCFIPLEQRA